VICFPTSMSICCGVNVVQTRRLLPSARVYAVNGNPGRGLYRHSRSSSRGAPGEDGPEDEEHPVVGRVRPLGKPVSELRGRAGNVVDDEVGHDHLSVSRQCRDVIPRTEPGIDLRVVLRVESRVRAVEWHVVGAEGIRPPRPADQEDH
jgi:hypothetical protein